MLKLFKLDIHINFTTHGKVLKVWSHIVPKKQARPTLRKKKKAKLLQQNQNMKWQLKWRLQWQLKIKF